MEKKITIRSAGILAAMIAALGAGELGNKNAMKLPNFGRTKHRSKTKYSEPDATVKAKRRATKKSRNINQKLIRKNGRIIK